MRQLKRRYGVDDQEFEQMLGRLMKQDFSIGTEKFRDALLERCLVVLDDDKEVAELDDSALELLAAAGDSDMGANLTVEPQDVFGNNEESCFLR